MSFPQEAGELYNRMLKRFRQEKAVWIKYGAFVLGRSQAGASHRVLQRALECLPAKERECFSWLLNTLGTDRYLKRQLAGSVKRVESPLT